MRIDSKKHVVSTIVIPDFKEYIYPTVIMQKLELTFFLFGILFLTSFENLFNHPEQMKVYICDSKDPAKYYLGLNCRGLNGWESEVIKVTDEGTLIERNRSTKLVRVL